MDFFEENCDEPLSVEKDGTYITVGQMHFYLNRRNGETKFKSGHPDFFRYYNMCRVYNRVSELMDEDYDSAILYWDTKKEGVSIGFPASGAVAEALSDITFAGEDEEGFEEDWYTN